MLDQRTLDLARQLIHPQLAERTEPLQHEIRALVARMNARGLAQSGAYVIQLGNLACSEIKIRVVLVRHNLFRVVSEGRLSYSTDLATDLMKEIEIHARQAEIDVTREVMPLVENLQKGL